MIYMENQIHANSEIKGQLYALKICLKYDLKKP